MEGLFSVQSAGQRLISPSLYQCIGSVSIRRSVSGFSMDTRISSRSPSQFTIRSQQVKIAQAYERGGTAFLSVLTDQKYFKRGFENLEAIRSASMKVLVGESIVKQNDPEKGIAGLFGMNISHT
ncbi:indole-3-glycerol phosphate synthase, chloroplastic-like [Brassica napus]|uniref:indole-3-glycerol phosphate synthase, chloroplastic-like n=1 Tax=Brassica napus TaxID=3708 RepID=UPI0006AAFFE1|nr:indole-3-glycerol phosphate synthase, chloroplastic-like [Brassica napus]